MWLVLVTVTLENSSNLFEIGPFRTLNEAHSFGWKLEQNPKIQTNVILDWHLQRWDALKRYFGKES